MCVHTIPVLIPDTALRFGGRLVHVLMSNSTGRMYHLANSSFFAEFDLDFLPAQCVLNYFQSSYLDFLKQNFDDLVVKDHICNELESYNL